MNVSSASFAAPDGLRLCERRWEPEGTPRAVVAMVHGIAEHVGRYAHVGAFLAEAGYVLAGFDLRGHGQSDGARAYVTSFETYLDDLDVFLDRVRAAWPEQPLFLLGHSMGGLVSTLYAIRRRPLLNGLVLSAPLLAAGADTSPLRMALVRKLGRIAPRMPVQKLEAGHISRDQAIVEAYDADPLNTRGWLRIGMGAAMLEALEAVDGRERELSLPLLILQGTGDVIVSPDGAQRLYDRAASADKTIRHYDGFYHEVFNEIGKERVLADVRAWLDAHTS